MFLLGFPTKILPVTVKIIDSLSSNLHKLVQNAGNCFQNWQRFVTYGL